MRKIITTTFLTLDGVMQAPGGPQEDTSGGFEYGGWSAHYWDTMMGEVMDSFMQLPFELLLGRKTYDIFASYWPTAKEDLLVAEKFNATRKYVVSRRPLKLAWAHSTLVTGDVPAELAKLKEMDGPDLWVHGSGNLIQTLLAHHLVDTMHLWTFPLTVGSGKRLFADGVQPEGLKLTGSKTATTGVVIASYDRAEMFKTGTVGG